MFKNNTQYDQQDIKDTIDKHSKIVAKIEVLELEKKIKENYVSKKDIDVLIYTLIVVILFLLSINVLELFM